MLSIYIPNLHTRIKDPENPINNVFHLSNFTKLTDFTSSHSLLANRKHRKGDLLFSISFDLSRDLMTFKRENASPYELGSVVKELLKEWNLEEYTPFRLSYWLLVPGWNSAKKKPK